MQYKLLDYLYKNPRNLWHNRDFVNEAIRYIYNSPYLNGIKILGTVIDGQTLVYSAADTAWEPSSSGGTGVSSFNTRTGDILLVSSDVTIALGYTPGIGNALTSNPLSQFASTTSAQLTSIISDKTGTGALVLGTSPTLTSPVVGTQLSTDNSTKAASTAFVNNAISTAISGVNPAIAVQAATTLSSNTSGLTYNNGVSGIGATFTGANNTALVVDGFTFTAIGQRLLVKNDTQSPSGAFNGVYYVTQIQATLLPIILTRALDYDSPSDINNTGAIPVVNGTINALTSWLLTSSVVTVGTNALTYSLFTTNPSTQNTQLGIYTGSGDGTTDVFITTVASGYTGAVCSFTTGGAASHQALAFVGCSLSGTTLTITFYDDQTVLFPPTGAFIITYLLSK